jgi:hypothetical protein
VTIKISETSQLTHGVWSNLRLFDHGTCWQEGFGEGADVPRDWFES